MKTWPGGQRDRDGAFQNRYKFEEILGVECPKCGAKPQEWCDRSGDKLGRRARAMLRAGTPPSHQERMWSRQGHDESEFPALLARQKPGWENGGVALSGKSSPRNPGPRGGCTPCATEREERRKLNLPGFPLDFPCNHPKPGDIPAPSPFPRRYTGERPCPECKKVVSVEVVVQSPKVIAYQCARGHRWLSAGAVTAR
jgi:endogenous inhibitor of DNA gyrase (YacG/DUF329 family)